MTNVTQYVTESIMSHRFKVQFEDNDALTRQVIGIKFDYYNKTMAVRFREDVEGNVRKSIKSIVMEGCQSAKFTVFRRHGEDPLYTDTFKNISVVAHTAEYDYNHTIPASQSVVFMYGSVSTTKKTD